MDYSKLSDFEIDKAVADALGIDYDIAIMFVSPIDKINGNHVEEYVRKKVTSNEKHWKRFSPTRIPNDAWNIILDNKISLNWAEIEKMWCAHVGGVMTDGCWCWDFDPEHHQDNANPLRAAMIIFLMMQDSRKSPS